MKRLSTVFLIVSILFFGIFAYFLLERFGPWGLSRGFENYRGQISSVNAPKSFVIPSLTISLPVMPASIQNGKFETTKNGVSYLASSAEPGKTGNAIFYGHNYANLLGKLHQIKPGDLVEIGLDTNKKVTYTIEYTARVGPDQVHILEQTNDKRITIYTCTGFLDSKRFVAVGKLLE